MMSTPVIVHSVKRELPVLTKLPSKCKAEAMGKHLSTKSRLTALLPKELAIEINNWLKKHPKSNRTDFVADSLIQKLRSLGVEVGALAGSAENSDEGCLLEEQKNERKNGELVTAWMDKRSLDELDRWRIIVWPQRTRTEFVTAAVAEALHRKRMISETQASKHGAWAEYDLAAEDLQKLVKEELHSWEFRPVEEMTPRELLTERTRIIARLEKIEAFLKRSPPIPAPSPGKKHLKS